jgi:hypothetical protein
VCGVICEQDVHNVWSSAAGQQLAEWQHAWMVERAAREKADRLVNGMRMSLASAHGSHRCMANPCPPPTIRKSPHGRLSDKLGSSAGQPSRGRAMVDLIRAGIAPL